MARHAAGEMFVTIKLASNNVAILFFNVLYPLKNIYLHFVYQYDNIILLQMQHIILQHRENSKSKDV